MPWDCAKTGMEDSGGVRDGSCERQLTLNVLPGVVRALHAFQTFFSGNAVQAVQQGGSHRACPPPTAPAVQVNVLARPQPPLQVFQPRFKPSRITSQFISWPTRICWTLRGCKQYLVSMFTIVFATYGRCDLACRTDNRGQSV